MPTQLDIEFEKDKNKRNISSQKPFRAFFCKMPSFSVEFKHGKQRKLVSANYKTVLGSAFLAFWTGLDFSLCPHRHIFRQSFSYGVAEKNSNHNSLAFHPQSHFHFSFTPIQFGLKNNYLAALDILLVLITLIWAMLAIFPHERWITYIQIPYLLWVIFATVLQLTVTYLNR